MFWVILGESRAVLKSKHPYTGLHGWFPKRELLQSFMENSITVNIDPGLQIEILFPGPSYIKTSI